MEEMTLSERVEAFKKEAKEAIQTLLKKYQFELSISSEVYVDDYHEPEANTFIDISDESDDIGDHYTTILSVDKNGYVLSDK